MLAIVPARGGSKGVPGKNIRQLCGKPLIAYTIEAASQAESIDRIVLSTDDQAIADVARSHDIDIPFMRPSSLAQDDSLALDAYIYTVDRLNNELGGSYDDVVILQPTSPLRTAEDIDRSVELFIEKQAESVIACTELPSPLEWVCRIDEHGALKGTEVSNLTMLVNRQEFRPHYVSNGAIHVFDYALLKERRAYYSDRSYAYVMPPERSVDIDTELDFALAELLITRSTSACE